MAWLNPMMISEKEYSKDLLLVKNRLLSVSVFTILIFGLPTLVISFTRIPITGWIGSMTHSLIAYGLMILLAIFHKTISFHWKTILFLLSGYLLGIHSWLSVGLMGDGMLYALMTSIMCTFFLGVRAGIFMAFLFYSSALLIGWMLTENLVTLEVDLIRYVNNPRAWILQCMVSVLFTAIIMNNFSRLNRFLEGSLADLGIKSRELKDMNIQLEEQIKERVRVEAKLAENEEKFRRIYQNISEMIVIAKEDNFIVEANPSFCRVTGYSLEELTQKKLEDFLPVQERQQLQYLFKGRPFHEVPEVELSLLPKEGPPIPVLISFSTFEIKDEKLNMVVARNLETTKSMEKLVLNTIIQTEEKERSRFARDLHDDIGPILSVSKLYLQSLEKEPDKAQKEVLLNKAIETLTEAIQNTRDLANSISPHILYNYGLGDALKVYIEKILSTCSLKIDLDIRLSDRLKEKHEVTLYRVMVELINNSVKYSRAKNIRLNLYIYQSNIFALYQDDGVGFDQHAVSVPGRGMGLFNIRNRIKSLGGKIDLLTAPGMGLKITIQLPY